MAEVNHNLDREAMRAILTNYLATKDETAIDQLCGILENAVANERDNARQEANAAMRRDIAIPGLTLDSDLDYLEAITMRIGQASGILALLGHANELYGDVPDDAFGNASWGAQHLLEEASELAGAAFTKRKVAAEQ